MDDSDDENKKEDGNTEEEEKKDCNFIPLIRSKRKRYEGEVDPRRDPPVSNMDWLLRIDIMNLKKNDYVETDDIKKATEGYLKEHRSLFDLVRRLHECHIYPKTLKDTIDVSSNFNKPTFVVIKF